METISEIIERISPLYEKRKKDKDKGKVSSIPSAEHKLVYESYAETLEPVYYYIVDLMEEFGFKVEKLIDNFSPTPGSTQFGEMGTRRSVMEQQVAKIMGDVNTVLRSVLNLIYDLKEFRIRLQQYKDLKNEKTKTAARLALKQVWLDKVDIQKGNSSLKAMAFSQQSPAGRSLLDAFLATDTIEQVMSLGMNDISKRIIAPRINEFNGWVVESEKELTKRYEIEKAYLKSQVSSLKLYSRWAKPYLLAAQKLTLAEKPRSAALVSAFNRTILELTVLGKSKIDVKDLADSGEFPEHLGKDKVLKKMRDYYNVVVVDFIFRGVPTQNNLIGRVDITFKGYALNQEELDKFEEELSKSDIEDVLRLSEGMTEDTLKQIQGDLDFFLEEDENKQEASSSEVKDVNPFKALVGGYEKKPEKKDEKKEEGKGEKKKVTIRKENRDEKEYILPFTEKNVKELTFSLFDVYKKAHGMPSYA